ncbi:hypothetical protein E3N88_24024 [Mikania micrantha]|uniref:Uncharacterized protein n=1 Tax=Mikania micrantha TaxID=192012 RepID=A0A5N6NGP3_9ASTR|nr:hypothetical protein E3N88_24024 [Mikania micrantha]
MVAPVFVLGKYEVAPVLVTGGTYDDDDVRMLCAKVMDYVYEMMCMIREGMELGHRIGIRDIGYSELDMASSSSAPYIHIVDLEDDEPVAPVPPSSPAPSIPSPPPSERDDSDPEEDPDEDPEEEPAEDTQEIPAEGPSTHPPPALDVPEPKRQQTDSEEIAQLCQDLYWANDRIEYNVRELWDANERHDNLYNLVNGMRDEIIQLTGLLQASENRAEILEGRLVALEDLVVSEGEEEDDEEEEGEELAPAVDSDPESTIDDPED